MQGLTDPPREDLTAGQVRALIECRSLDVTSGLDLLGVDENPVTTAGVEGDISSDLLDGIVSHASFADIHGTLRVSITRQLEWGSQRLRPYMVLTDNLTGVTARFNLGVYLPETPDRNVGASPTVYEVECYDKLVVLRTPHPSGWSGTAGSQVVGLIEDLIGEAGESKVRIESSDKTLPVAMARPLDPAVSYLSIVNDLLASIGYRGLWVDWDGYYRSEPYVAPSSRAPEWTYDVGSPSTTVAPRRSETQDLFDVPNRWVFVQTNRDATDPPSEGDGMYTVVNQSTGPTSIDARGGRVKPAVVKLEAAGQSSLVAQGDRISRDDQQTTGVIALTTDPNPAHWHFDVLTLVDPLLPPSPRKMVEGRWSLPLRGGLMTHELRTA